MKLKLLELTHDNLHYYLRATFENDFKVEVEIKRTADVTHLVRSLKSFIHEMGKVKR